MADLSDVANLSGTALHWRIVQRHYALQDDKKHPEIFTPHVQPDDFYWKKAEEYMFELDDSFSFWKNADSLAVLGEDKLPISFNLIDNANSYIYFAIYYFTKEDIYQQIWVFCLENIDKFDPKKGVSLRNYLSIVAKNGMINLYKKTTNSTIKIPDCCVDGDEYHKASCQKWYDYTKFLNRAKDLQKVTEK
jgi:hypothetical protein